MGVDLRQVIAGILTITMFVMLGQMIRRDYLDPAQENLPGDSRDLRLDGSKVSMSETVSSSTVRRGPWMDDNQELAACWTKATLELGETSNGYVTFSLTNGPEYHVSQVSDAVVVARYLGATLVLPDIRGNRPGDERKFGDIYDVTKFIASLDGVVKVVNELPDEISLRNLAVVRVPSRVTIEHIIENIEPVFKSKGSIRIATYFPSVNLRKPAQESKTDSAACLGMFGTLELRHDINEVVESMIERLRTLSKTSDGRFIAVDLRVDILEKKNCHEAGSVGTKTCYSPQEIAVFLRKIGFDKDTTIYLTQSGWDDSLNILKDIFPKTYTKEYIMPADKRDKFLNSGNSEVQNVVDFHICSKSDVFVPAISGLFYANTVGKRIALGKSQILVPAEISGTSALATSFLSPYVSKRNHLAFSCFC